MKKILYFSLAATLLLAVALSGCGGGNGGNNPGGNGNYPFKIVFNSQRNNSSGGSDIFSMDIDGSNVLQLTMDNDTTMNNNPELSPDCSKVLYLKRKYSVNGTTKTIRSFEVYVMNADGTRGTLVYTFLNTDAPQWTMFATWTPNGKIIVYEAGNFNINIFLSAGASPTLIPLPEINGNTPMISSVPRVSPKGDKIVFEHWNFAISNYEIYVANFNGSTISNPIKIGSGFRQPYWSSDGTKIICTLNAGGNIYLLDKVDALNANGTQLTNHYFETAMFSLDGQKIILTEYSGKNSEIYTIDKPDGKGTLNLGLTQLTFNNYYDGYYECDHPWFPH